MTSLRSVTLDVGTQTVPIQLGGQTQIRGLQSLSGVLYPRFTGVHIEDTALSQTLAAAATTTGLFGSIPITGKSFISEDVSRSAGVYILPYLGVYRVLVQVAYTVSSAQPVVVELDLVYSTAGTQTTITERQSARLASGTIVIDRDLQCDEIVSINVRNLSPGSIQLVGTFDTTAPSTLRAANTSLDIHYLATL